MSVPRYLASILTGRDGGSPPLAISHPFGEDLADRMRAMAEEARAIAVPVRT
jgi:hypothetical protein